MVLWILSSFAWPCIPPDSAAWRLWMPVAMVRKAFSTFSELFALVSRKEIFREEARS